MGSVSTRAPQGVGRAAKPWVRHGHSGALRFAALLLYAVVVAGEAGSPVLPPAATAPCDPPRIVVDIWNDPL